jgi:hypothetical protein
MTVDAPNQVIPQGDVDIGYDEFSGYGEFSVKTPRRAVITEQPVVKNIIDVTMVGLVGGGPRLAVKAARVMLEDAYASRDTRARLRARRLPRRRQAR